MTSLLEEFKGRFEQTGERISKLESLMEIFKCEEQKAKRLGKLKRS